MRGVLDLAFSPANASSLGDSGSSASLVLDCLSKNVVLILDWLEDPTRGRSFRAFGMYCWGPDLGLLSLCVGAPVFCGSCEALAMDVEGAVLEVTNVGGCEMLVDKK